jgi:mRNA-degrading endonuclease toxin of MazEF toxin-antitoxin module
VSQLCRGRIVWVELLDPQGCNRKCRPAVIVTPDADIRADGDVWMIAISTQLGEAPAEVQVELPWDPRGHPRTGLKERCAAVCPGWRRCLWPASRDTPARYPAASSWTS